MLVFLSLRLGTAVRTRVFANETHRRYYTQPCRIFCSQILPSNLMQLSQTADEAYKEGDYVKAISKWEKILTMSGTMKNSPDIPSTFLLRSCKSLACAYRNVGNMQKELGTLEKMQNIIARTYGEGHPQYIALLCQLAESKETIGDYREMIVLLEEALDRLEKQKQSPKGDVKKSRVLLLLSRAYQHVGDAKMQLRTAERAYFIARRHFREENQVTTNALLSVARARGANGEVEEQVKIAQEVFVTQSSQFGRLNGQLAVTAMEVAAAFRNQGNFEKEREFIDISIDIQKRSIEPVVGARLVESLLHLGDVMGKLGQENIDQMISCYKEAVKVAQREFCGPTVFLGKALMRVAKCLEMKGERQKVLPLLNEAKVIIENSGVLPHHPAVRELNDYVGNDSLYKE